jgi:hypothetical protein
MEPSAAEVRQWAQERGIEVNERGPLSSDVYMAYEMAHGSADDSLTVTMDEGLSGPVEPGPAHDAPDLPSEPAPDPELEPDPDPRHPKHRGAARPPAVRVTAAVRKDIKGKIALLAAIPAGMFAQRDPVCGAVLEEQLPEISDALTDLICDSPDLVVFFTSGAGYMKWLRLAAAAGPVAQIAYQHHIAKSIGQGGGPGQQNGQYAPADMSRFHAPAI